MRRGRWWRGASHHYAVCPCCVSDGGGGDGGGGGGGRCAVNHHQSTITHLECDGMQVTQRSLSRNLGYVGFIFVVFV